MVWGKLKRSQSSGSRRDPRSDNAFVADSSGVIGLAVGDLGEGGSGEKEKAEHGVKRSKVGLELGL